MSSDVKWIKIVTDIDCWESAGCEVDKTLRIFNIDFPMVKWEDNEPWLIEDLKKLEVVEEYEKH